VWLCSLPAIAAIAAASATAASSWCRGALRLVCKRWKQVVDTSPALSQLLYISPRKPALLDPAALQRLAAAQAGTLRFVHLNAVHHHPGVLAAAAQLTALTKLELVATGDSCERERLGEEWPDFGAELAAHGQAQQGQGGLSSLARLAALSLQVDGLQAPTCGLLPPLTTLTSQAPSGSGQPQQPGAAGGRQLYWLDPCRALGGRGRHACPGLVVRVRQHAGRGRAMLRGC